VISEFERDTRRFVQRTLYYYHIVNLRICGFEYHVELPSSSSALVDNEFGACFEWSERLESHEESERVLGTLKSFILLLEKD